MIADLLEKDLVEFAAGNFTWEEALQRSGDTMLRNHYIEQSYLDEIVENIKTHGPYIVLLPGIAMPHATVGAPGVLKTGMSLTIFDEEIPFDEEKSARLFFTMATNDADKHLENIQNLMALLMDDDKRETLVNAKSLDDLRGIK